jgi:DNA-binding transcriptional ArsR family regulator
VGTPTTPVSAPTRETIRHPAPESFDLAHVLRTAGDPLRLAMLRALAADGEQLCGALGESLGLPKSTASYHVRLLREAGLTHTRQEGTLRYISLRRDDLESRFPGLVDVLVAPAADR